jgi:hypothetical protein
MNICLVLNSEKNVHRVLDWSIVHGNTFGEDEVQYIGHALIHVKTVALSS